MRAQVTWTGPGYRMVGETAEGPAIVLDSKGGTYGTHSGLTPMELVLVGLAGCTAMDVVSIMAKKRQPMTNMQVKVDAENADQHPMVFTKIHITYVAYGSGIDEKALARAIRLSEERYCSVQAMLKSSAEISSSFEIAESVNPTTPGAPIPAE
ncbi:MAG: OsmC family protein [Anaerolineae bacterium]|nr:OsmC family protein [Anaerolineae bacterium]